MASSSIAARSTFVGKAVQAKTQQPKASRAQAVVCKAQSQETTLATRRAAMSAFAAAIMAVSAKPSFAAYGEGANIFGARPTASEYIPYAGEGFALLMPDKFNPSKEQDFKGTVLRYEDNFDAVSNLIVTCNPTSKTTIKEYGSPEKFLAANSFLLGKTSQEFASRSEGGFAANRVAAASLLAVNENEKKGKTYYELEVLTRTADGDEGGRHHLISAVVSGGKEYVLKVQVGDKRWFKGLERPSKEVIQSFIVA
uniref:PsbP C-terminal domain-containing protein n=1 Tax=Vannella robusta TaxID=1487602 RepID=A0A7S4MHW1_9EUKA|mmetsp:Transcript_22507/g.28739  ORF Transcript_22507/g.28739 Transcript_22507/m.28739 type:complete len:254 (+) Transcript_22507:48-809(+)